MIHRRGVVYFVEVKRSRRDGLNPRQKEMHEALRLIGIRVIIYYPWEGIPCQIKTQHEENMEYYAGEPEIFPS